VRLARRGTQPKIAEVPPREARMRAIAERRDLSCGDISWVGCFLLTKGMLTKGIQTNRLNGFKVHELL
jgi:hypothetical protein